MVVEGVGEGKDFKLYLGEGREWDGRETGTQHDPGIQLADAEELLDKWATVVVMSRGMDWALKTRPETTRLLEQRGSTVHMKETKAGGWRSFSFH